MNVPSFQMNHDQLLRGVYVSRKDDIEGHIITTFDIRMKLPNRQPPMDIPAVHTLEHLLAVYLRSEESGWADQVIYIGPMGCRTGIYLIVKGDRTPAEILPLLQNTFRYVMNFEGKVPATVSKECGNYLDHNLFLAKWEAAEFYNEVLIDMKPENMVYPE